MDQVYAGAAYAAAMGALAVWLRRRKRRKRRRSREPATGLDRVLLTIGGGPWRRRDLHSGGVLVLGSTGSGKTSGPFDYLIDAALASGGVMAITNKPDDRARLLAAARRAGRLDDVVVIDSDPGSHSLNVLDVVLSGLSGADDATRAAVASAAFSNFVQVLSRQQSTGDGENAFWRAAAERMTVRVFHLCLLAGESCSVPLLLAAVQSIPATPACLNDDAWKAKTLNQLLRKGYQNRLGREREYEELSAYFLGELAALSSRTKSVIQATVAGTADAVGRGLAGRLLTGSSTFDLAAAIRHGAVLIIDLDAAYGEVQRLVGVGYKVMYQTEVLRRRVSADSPSATLLIDEFQLYVTRQDHQFVSRCRSYYGSMVVATQGIESLRSELGGDSAKDETDALASNLNTKIVALPTYTTSVWICEQLGKTRIELGGGSASTPTPAGPFDLMFPQQQGGQSTGSFSEQIAEVLRPDELAGMRNGGPSNEYLVDTLVVQPGRRFPDTGLHWAFQTWRQRR